MTARDMQQRNDARGGLVVAPVPRLALSVEEACAALGVSWDLWNERVAPDVAIVRIGRRKLVAVADLQRWLNEHGERVADSAGRGA